MLIALLAVLGVDLIAIVVVLAAVLARKRWVKRQPGAFRGAIRVADGEIDGLGPKWHRGYVHWVRDVLVWTKAPFLFRNEILATDGSGEPRPARPDEVKRLGDHPIVVPITIGTQPSRSPPTTRNANWSTAPTATPHRPRIRRRLPSGPSRDRQRHRQPAASLRCGRPWDTA